MDASTLAAPNRNYLEALLASSALIYANEMFGLFLPPHFSLTGTAQCTILHQHTCPLFLGSTNSTPLHTVHASFDTNPFQAFKHCPPIVSSSLPSLDGIKSLLELFSLLCLVDLLYYIKSYLKYRAFPRGLGIEQNIP